MDNTEKITLSKVLKAFEAALEYSLGVNVSCEVVNGGDHEAA